MGSKKEEGIKNVAHLGNGYSLLLLFIITFFFFFAIPGGPQDLFLAQYTGISPGRLGACGRLYMGLWGLNWGRPHAW